MTTPNPPARQGGDSALQRPHILVVTADEELKNFLVEGLVIGGLWVSVVASAIQTLEVLRLRSFDLMIIDQRLSGLPALELIRRLRGRSDRAASNSPRTDVPILLLADAFDSINQLAVNEVGAAHVLTPPLELEELVPLLYSIVASWREQHPDRPWADSATLPHSRP